MVNLKSFIILFSFVEWFKALYHDGDAKIRLRAPWSSSAISWTLLTRFPICKSLNFDFQIFDCEYLVEKLFVGLICCLSLASLKTTATTTVVFNERGVSNFT